MKKDMKKIFPIIIIGMLIQCTFNSMALVDNNVKVESFHIEDEINNTLSDENTTELEITIYKNSINMITSFAFKNIGEYDAINLSWNVEFFGGIILYGRQLNNTYDINRNLSVGEDITIRLVERYGATVNKRTVLGFGLPTMTSSTEADNSEKVNCTINTLLFLIFLFEV